jgi:hypothetical protein
MVTTGLLFDDVILSRQAKSSRKAVINGHQQHTALVQGQNNFSNDSFLQVQKLHSLAATEK